MPDTVEFFGREHPRQPGCVYIDMRAISATVNLNFDGWPASQLEASYQTFIGCPVFVDHHSEDVSRSRGIVLDAEFLTSDDDAWVELLLEIDAEAFPKLAEEIVSGGIDSSSMGCTVGRSVCSVCGASFDGIGTCCEHIPSIRGGR